MTRGARSALAPALLLALAAPGLARAAPGSEGGPPGANTGPGDILRPPGGSPGAPKAPGTPLSAETAASGATPAGGSRLLEAAAAATGQEADFAFMGGMLGAIDQMIESGLMLSGTPAGAGASAVPLPVIANSKNEGFTGGVMVPIFFRNEDGEVDRVLDPIVTYNGIFGLEAGAHLLYYRDNLQIGAGAILSNHIARNFYFELLDESVADSQLALELFAKNEVDPASRFYGFGPLTAKDDQTNDTNRETVFRWNLGADITPRLQLFWRQRFRDVKISSGRVDGIPSTPDVFPDIPGMPASTIDGNGLELRWDERDEAFLPRNGFYVGLVAELNLGLGGDTQRFYPRCIVDLRGFWSPVLEDYLTFAVRLRFERLTGSRVPFYEQAILGGRNSLRAYGEDRFTDLASGLLELEARITVLRITLFDARTAWQVVPFFDYGRVFHDFQSKVFRLWRWSPGVGLRLAVIPNIITRCDVAYGNEGVNVYLGLGLPF